LLYVVKKQIFLKYLQFFLHIMGKAFAGKQNALAILMRLDILNAG